MGTRTDTRALTTVEQAVLVLRWFLDGTRVADRPLPHPPGPAPKVDLWWSGKHANHGGNIQVVTATDGWPPWTSEVRPGREYDTTALRAHPEILPAQQTWT